MILLTTFPNTNPARYLEFQYCLDINVKYFDRIIVFNEGNIEYNNSKVDFINISTRMCFKRIFDYINNNISKDTICVVANGDIYFDDTILEFENKAKFNMCSTTELYNTMYLLTRYNSDDKLQGGLCNVGSVDVWIVKSNTLNITEEILFGVNGCDSYLSYVLIEHGYTLFNPALSIKCKHKHSHDCVNSRSTVDNKNYWNKPYKIIPWEYL